MPLPLNGNAASSDRLPPMRATHEWPTVGGGWSYDCWGRHGRPVVLIHPVLFDRAMWWPAAADLRPYATVIAVDLPGHGRSRRRRSYRVGEIVDELAHLVHSLALTRAPVVVGHASAAPLAEAFAARYAVHALVIVDPLDRPDLEGSLEDYLSALSPEGVPARYRGLVDPVRDASLLNAYAVGLRGTRPAAHRERLIVHSRFSSPSAGCARGRHENYDVDGRYAHLTDLDRFVADLCALL